MDIARSEIEGDIPARFRLLASVLPGHPAVRKSEACATFAELDAASDRVAGNLLAGLGVEPGPVAILLPPGISAITAMLGIIKTGKMFVLLPIDGNPQQQASIWENSLRPAILTDPENSPLAASIAGNERLVLDVNQHPQEPFDPTRISVTPDSPVMITYSSGTTSAPKGVVSTHRMILHSTWFYSHLHNYSEQDRITYLSAFASSAAMSYNLYSIFCGATLVLPPAGNTGSFPYLEWLQREKITVLSITALPLFQQYLRASRGEIPLPDLREITIGGQELSRAELEELRGYCSPSAVFVHRLASSDVNQISELWIRPGADLPWEKIPVGRAVPGKEVLLLDEDHHPVGPGETGEIAVRSRYLPAGYWGQPELTSKKFLPDPDGGQERIFLTGDIGRFLPDGSLEFRGRKDNLVRIQNQNVQLEEIDERLRQMPGIREASVQVTPWGSGGKRLTAYIVPQVGIPLTVDTIRRHMSKSLPPYMIPSLYVFLSSLPALAGGKIDRNALPAPASIRPPLSTPFEKPRNAVEEKICAVWSDVLSIRPIGVNDNFYDLGGDSLLVLTMTVAIEQEFKRPIPQAYYRSVTVAALAEYWRQEDSGDLSREEDLPSLSPAGEKGTAHGTRFEIDPRRRKVRRTQHRSNGGISLASFIVANLPYRTAVRTAAQICRFPPMRRLCLQEKILLFRDFRSALGGCPDAPADAELISLTGNLLWTSHVRAGLGDLADQDTLAGMRASPARFWRGLAGIIDHSPRDVFDRYFQFQGWQYLEEAYAAGNGVVLVTLHSTCNRITSTAIYRRLRAQPIQTISQKRAQRIDHLQSPGSEPDAPLPDDIMLISDLVMQGYNALRAGQIIQLVPDGRDFSIQDEMVQICGRKTYIQSGFAKLALLSNSSIIPVASTRRLDGSIRATFFPPLVPSDMHASLEGKISDLVRQYSAFLEHNWRMAPEAVSWSKMSKHLERPSST